MEGGRGYELGARAREGWGQLTLDEAAKTKKDGRKVSTELVDIEERGDEGG